MHFAFHPCGGGELETYDGYLELASTNDIIVVYPLSLCWNGGGTVPQEEGLYLTKDGLYPKAIKAMMCRVTSTEETANCPMQASALTSVGLALLASLVFLQ